MRFWPFLLITACLWGEPLCRNAEAQGRSKAETAYQSPCVEIAALVNAGHAPLRALLHGINRYPEQFKDLNKSDLHHAHFGVEPGQLEGKPGDTAKGRATNQAVLKKFLDVQNLKQEAAEYSRLTMARSILGKHLNSNEKSELLKRLTDSKRAILQIQQITPERWREIQMIPWKALQEVAPEPLRSLYRVNAEKEGIDKLEGADSAQLYSQLVEEAKVLEFNWFSYVSSYLNDEYRSPRRILNSFYEFLLYSVPSSGLIYWISQGLPMDYKVALSASTALIVSIRYMVQPQRSFVPQFWRNVFRAVGLAKTFPGLKPSVDEELKALGKQFRSETLFLNEKPEFTGANDYARRVLNEGFQVFSRDMNSPKDQSNSASPAPNRVSTVWKSAPLPKNPEQAALALFTQYWHTLNPDPKVIENTVIPVLMDEQINNSILSFAVGLSTLENHLTNLLDKNKLIHPLHILYALSMEKMMLARLMEIYKYVPGQAEAREVERTLEEVVFVKPIAPAEIASLKRWHALREMRRELQSILAPLLGEKTVPYTPEPFIDPSKTVNPVEPNDSIPKETEAKLIEDYLNRVPEIYRRIETTLSTQINVLQSNLAQSVSSVSKEKTLAYLDQIQMLQAILAPHAEAIRAYPDLVRRITKNDENKNGEDATDAPVEIKANPELEEKFEAIRSALQLIDKNRKGEVTKEEIITFLDLLDEFEAFMIRNGL